MVRKSDRNKTNAAATPVEKPTTRKRRGRGRRKDSSSESESESNPVVREESVSSIALPQETKVEEVEDVESSSSGTRSRNRRTSKRNLPTKEEPPQVDATAVENPSEWNEDATFWSGADSSAAVSVEASNEEEGSTWKIQSSNGSGGEIQKLKICRQRPTDSTGSSSPAKECASPKIKRIAASEKVDGDSAELELDTPMDIVDIESDKVVTEQIIVAPSITDIPEPSVPPPSSTLAKTSSSPEITPPSATEDNIMTSIIQEKEIIIPGLDLVSDVTNKNDHTWMNTSDVITEVSMIEMPPSKEEMDIEMKNVEAEQPLGLIFDVPEELKQSLIYEDENSKTAVPDIGERKETEVKVDEIKSTDLNVGEKKEIAQEDDDQMEEKEVEVEEEVIMTTEECEDNNSLTVIESTTPDVVAPTISVPSTPTSSTTSKCLSGAALSVSSELAMEQIAKKLNERAARVSIKENCDDKEKKNVSSKENSPDIDRSIEEGEIVSSAAATPDPPQPSAAKNAKATVVIMPEETVCLPTKLNRNIDENPPEEEVKPRVSKSRICLSPQISITSELLKILEPDAKPVPIEELGFGIIDSDGGEEVGQTDTITSNNNNNNNNNNNDEDDDDVDETKSIVNKFDTKRDNVEVTVLNDVREVKKKKPIVIVGNSSSKVTKTITTTAGPKLPLQENNKAIRKISIVSADAKSLRKSPSPSRKKATEVLYITNLVRPFTVPQLRELLARTGTIAQNGFYIDKIKSKCYVKYTDVEMAIETRHALHGVRWPVNNPKTLRVDFALPEDMAVVQKLADEEGGNKKLDNDTPAAVRPASGSGISIGGGWLNEQAALKPSRRVTATVREWDMGKIIGEDSGTTKTSPPLVESKKKVEEDWNRKKEKPVRNEKERDRRRAHSPEHKVEIPKKIKKKDIDAPAKLLDDLFRKTKATPCIYWLPLTAAQIAVKEEMRRQHMAEHERRLAEIRKSDTTTRRDNKDRDRDRDRRKK